MSFHLRISTQRDPGSTSGTAQVDRQKRRSRVATFEITGELSQPDRQRLQHQVESLAFSEVDTIVIDISAVSTAEQREAERFCQWISRLRRAGRPLHVAARQAEVYRLLYEVGHQPEWLMPFSGVEAAIGRCVIFVEGINPNV